MTLTKIKQTISEIKRLACFDPEAAHNLEDSLYINTLREIVRLVPNSRAGKLAEAALEAVDLDFPRWKLK